jgi:hypothetical protein
MPADRFTRGVANVVPGEEHAASRVSNPLRRGQRPALTAASTLEVFWILGIELIIRFSTAS